VKVCVENYRILRYLFLIDREHIEEGREVEKIEEVLRNEGFREIRVAQSNSLFHIECLLGPHRVTIYVVCFGF